MQPNPPSTAPVNPQSPIRNPQSAGPIRVTLPQNTPPSAAPAPNQRARVRVDGKFFRLGDRKFYVKGITYGPFAPQPDGNRFATPGQMLLDFKLIRDLGANVVRVYHVPPAWVL